METLNWQIQKNNYVILGLYGYLLGMYSGRSRRGARTPPNLGKKMKKEEELAHVHTQKPGAPPPPPLAQGLDQPLIYIAS